MLWEPRRSCVTVPSSAEEVCRTRLWQPPQLDYLVVTLLLSFRRDVDEICALLGYYAASCGNCVPTFRSHLQGSLTLEYDNSCPETSVNKYHTTARSIPEERRSHLPSGRLVTKEEFTLEQAMKAQRGSSGIAPLFL